VRFTKGPPCERSKEFNRKKGGASKKTCEKKGKKGVRRPCNHDRKRVQGDGNNKNRNGGVVKDIGENGPKSQIGGRVAKDGQVRRKKTKPTKKKKSVTRTQDRENSGEPHRGHTEGGKTKYSTTKPSKGPN